MKKTKKKALKKASPKKVVKKAVKKVTKKAIKPQVAKTLVESSEIKVLDRIDAELAKKPAKAAKAVNRKGTVVIEADQDADSSKNGKSVVMTGDGPKVVEDNGDIE